MRLAVPWGGVIFEGQTQEQGDRPGNEHRQTAQFSSQIDPGYHVIPNKWLLQGHCRRQGTLKWFSQELGPLNRSWPGTGISPCRL